MMAQVGMMAHCSKKLTFWSEFPLPYRQEQQSEKFIIQKGSTHYTILCMYAYLVLRKKLNRCNNGTIHLLYRTSSI